MSKSVTVYGIPFSFDLRDGGVIGVVGEDGLDVFVHVKRGTPLYSAALDAHIKRQKIFISGPEGEAPEDDF